MTENNNFNNTENERYCVRAGYWHNYAGIGRCEDENLTTNEVCDLINEQNETIQELYDFRLVYNALLFNEWAKNGKYEVYKSKRHYDGELCFDGEWFIVVGILPTGQVTNHYPIRIKPDDIWLLIVQAFSHHVNINSEELREMFKDNSKIVVFDDSKRK